jgi:adenylosuccinate lyase
MGGHSMLARTHGQPASTRLGKEISVFVERLEAAHENKDY